MIIICICSKKGMLQFIVSNDRLSCSRDWKLNLTSRIISSQPRWIMSSKKWVFYSLKKLSWWKCNVIFFLSIVFLLWFHAFLRLQKHQGAEFCFVVSSLYQIHCLCFLVVSRYKLRCSFFVIIVVGTSQRRLPYNGSLGSCWLVRTVLRNMEVAYFFDVGLLLAVCLFKSFLTYSCFIFNRISGKD